MAALRPERWEPYVVGELPVNSTATVASSRAGGSLNTIVVVVPERFAEQNVTRL